MSVFIFLFVKLLLEARLDGHCSNLSTWAQGYELVF